MPVETKILSCNVSNYHFQSIIKEMFDSSSYELNLLHQYQSISSQTLFENDTNTIFQQVFYKSPLYEKFRDAYYNFVVNEIGKLYPDETFLIVQKDPQFRVCVPNNTALGHKDEDFSDLIGVHCDGDYNHPKQEINYIIALTDMYDSNSVYIETDLLSNVFEPIKLDSNQIIQFWGNKLRHGNKINVTGYTRVSVDFRIIPYSIYDSSYELKSVHGNRRFVDGDYFVKLKNVI